MMNKQNRRIFLQTSTAALAGSLGSTHSALLTGTSPSALALGPGLEQTSQNVSANDGRRPQRVGVIIGSGKGPDAAMTKVQDLGEPTCQVYVDDFAPEEVGRLRQALDKYGIEATSLGVGGRGKEVWDFYQGPLTIGLVPRETRAARIAHIKNASDFAKQCGIPAVQTHCGFIPENPNDDLYRETVTAMREVAAYCKGHGQNFRYETGQETPIALVRAIHDVGLDNQGINFDLANLILYGKANPVDAIELLGPFVQGIHAKDGLWPTNPKELGEEVPIGKGKVDFPRITPRLKMLNYG